MKHFPEILEDIKATFNAIKAAEAEENILDNEWANIVDIKERHARRLELEKAISAAAERANDLRIMHKLLQNNARVALYHDVLPVVLEVLQKYAGKPYGEKTRAKIAQEVQEKTGARAYIGTNYGHDEINIYPDVFGNVYNITCGPHVTAVKDEQPRLLNGNRIQPQPFDVFSLWYIKTNYVDDVPAAVAELKRLYAQAVAKQEELASICSAFNAYAVTGIESICQDKRIYSRLIVR